MRSSLKNFYFATLLSCALVFPSFVLRAQESSKPATRPRRATQEAWPTPTPNDAINANAGDETSPPQISYEPVIRIGLATGARGVNVSTTGRLLNASEPGRDPVAFDVSRVRIEPRTLPVLPAPGATTEDDALALENASASNTTAAASTAKARSAIKLTSRASAPTRGEVIYAQGSSKPLLNARAPVVFASDDEAQHPVRYNEKAYRGRIEVFANSRGTLTVVNVVALEDYVRGVVPNELSPGGWPELEALKAQAVAARTYTISNLGRFKAEGFDLTPDTRSQVYGGRSTEHPLTDRAVSETRGRVATFNGTPINALYTSTCGGRTEDAQNIFGGGAVPYLRGRECALESKERFAAYTIRTTREPPPVKSAEHATSSRDVALLATHGLTKPSRLSDEWLASNISLEELREMLGKLASLTRQPQPFVTAESLRPGGFATALAAALDGESRGATLLNSADVEYLLAFRDSDDVAQQNRADVAAMLREGIIGLHTDGTLRPRLPLSRARALRSIARALETRKLLRLQRASARSSSKEALVLRPTSGMGESSLKVAADAYLFNAFGEALYPVREINFVGGEPVAYHTNAGGEIDYLEARPSASGAATDHYSPYANWSVSLTPTEVLSRLGRSAPNVGALIDLRVRQRGVSGRVLDLEVIGTKGAAHVRGGRVRSALGLREQLFIIDRGYDESGRVTKYTFNGRGWGHGVGLCQVGAYGLARAGLSYEKILKSYYAGINVTKLY